MNRKQTVILSGILIILLCAVVFVRKNVNEKEDMRTLFQLSFQDLDFSEEITGGYEDSYYPATYTYESSEPNPRRLRSWGIAREKNHKTPRADPGAPELLKKYNSIYLADTEKPVIYLTFDEGYENGYTDDILDVLTRKKVNAVFFITGPYLNRHEDLVRRMVEEGHAVGNHTVRHLSLPTLTDEELEKEVADLDRLFYEKFKKHMVFLRPPKGEYSEHSLELTSKMGYVNMFWSFAYNDWNINRQKGWEHAYNMVMPNLHNGAVLLLHAVSSDNANALERIIDDARKMGYEFGNVFDLEAYARGES